MNSVKKYKGIVIVLCIFISLFSFGINLDTTTDIIDNRQMNNNISINTSSNSEIPRISYDIEYTYAESQRISYNFFPSFMDSKYVCILNNGNHRVISILSQRTLIVSNVSDNVDDPRKMINQGWFNYSFPPDFRFEFMFNHWESGSNIHIGGKNSNNDIVIRRLTLNYTAGSFNINGEHIINSPSSINVTNLEIRNVEVIRRGDGSQDKSVMINGFFTNNESDNMPLLFSYNPFTNSSSDLLFYDSVTDFHENFDDVILYSFFKSYVPVLHDRNIVITNKRIIEFSVIGINVIDHEYLLDEIDYIHKEQRFSRHRDDNERHKIIYNSFIAGLGFEYVDLYTINYNTSLQNTEYNIHNEIGSNIHILVQNNIFHAMTDFIDGVIVGGNDFYQGIKWHSWSVSTGDKGTLFDRYNPSAIIEYDDEIEIYFVRNNQIWVTRITSNLTSIYNIRNSRIEMITTTQVDIRHEKGSDLFEYNVFGTIKRNATNSSDYQMISIIPIFIKPGAILSPNRDMFTISSPYEFDLGDKSGIEIRMTNYYSYYMNDIMNFHIKFYSVFAPFTHTFDDIEITVLNCRISYIVMENYENGSITQKLMNDLETVKNLIIDFDYTLRTQIVLLDSHLLNEIHVEIDGIEYDPFSIIFKRPNVEIFIRDKLTNDTLYDVEIQFRDPLFIDIPPKYEFLISYFSNVDRFGIDPIWFNTFVNGTQISGDSVRILSPNAEIVVMDFSNSILTNTTINRFINGTNIRIGLDIVTVLINNNYNRTMRFIITKEGYSIDYEIPSQSGIMLRLAFGIYSYVVMDMDGTILHDETKEIGRSTSISFGFTDTIIIDWDDLPFTFVDTIVSIAAVAVAIVVVFFAQYIYTSTKTKKKLNGRRR